MKENIQLIQSLPGYRLMRLYEKPNSDKGDMVFCIKNEWNEGWKPTRESGDITVKKCLCNIIRAYARKINA